MDARSSVWFQTVFICSSVCLQLCGCDHIPVLFRLRSSDLCDVPQRILRVCRCTSRLSPVCRRICVHRADEQHIQNIFNSGFRSSHALPHGEVLYVIKYSLFQKSNRNAVVCYKTALNTTLKTFLLSANVANHHIIIIIQAFTRSSGRPFCLDSFKYHFYDCFRCGYIVKHLFHKRKKTCFGKW